MLIVVVSSLLIGVVTIALANAYDAHNMSKLEDELRKLPNE